MAFQLISDGKKEEKDNKIEKKRSLLAPSSFYFPKHCPCAAWILPNALMGHGWGQLLALQVKILGGICIILHIQSGSAMSAAA